MKLEFSRQIFEKYSNIKLHENPSSGSRVVACGRAYMTKLILAFHDFANVHTIKKGVVFIWAFQPWHDSYNCPHSKVPEAGKASRASERREGRQTDSVHVLGLWTV
jgi:hypothetical protein